MLRYLVLFFSTVVFAQQYKNVDFIACTAYLTPNVTNKSISGKVVYDFQVLNKRIDTISIDAVAMEFSDVVINGKKVEYINTGKALQLFEGFKKGKNTLSFHYSAKPKQALYFTGEGENLQIWTQGQGKYTSHWLPSFDDVNEKVIFNLNIDFEDKYYVLSNGINRNGCINEVEGRNLWSFIMQKPMSSYLVMLAIGDFVKQTEKTASGSELEFYLDRKDSLKFEPTYRHSKQIFEFLEKEIGIPYPWGVYRQVPVRDFLYAGMENTTSTIFSQDFVVDSIGYNDKNYLNVNAHELAHQWFGDLVTATESKHHWLQEGFATYYALLAEQAVFGDDYFYHQLWEIASQLERAESQDTEPILSSKASSFTFYKKGAWALHALRSDIGAERFRKAVKNYLEKYAYKNVDTDEFLAEIKKVAPQYSTETFKKEWLEATSFDFEGVQKYLANASFIKTLYEVIKSYQVPYAAKKNRYKEIMQSSVYFPVKTEILMQCENVPFKEKRELIELALATQNIQVRQAVAETIDEIPEDFRTSFESLLQDDSYRTRELALFKLWRNFENDQYYYTMISKDWGKDNNTLKMANLTLQIVTKGVSALDKMNAIAELERMTELPYDATIRQTAIETILSLRLPSERVLVSLLEATLHHRWQFVKFGKDSIRKLLQNEEQKQRFLMLQPKLPEELQKRLQEFLDETNQ